jgi:serine protease AprX
VDPRQTPRRARALQRVLALIAAMTLVLGLVSPASAAPKTPTLSADWSKLEPALAAQIKARPTKSYDVIVTRQPASDKSRFKRLEKAIEDWFDGTRKTRKPERLGLVAGHVVQMRGTEIVLATNLSIVKSISLDHPVTLEQISTVPTGGVVGGVVNSVTGATSLISTWTQEANAPAVWNTYGNTGAGVTVAVLDSGIQPSPDLSNVVFGIDTATGQTTLADKGGHGTHVAGIIAGNGKLSGGAYKGVAPGARLLSIKVTSDTGAANYSSVIRGLQWIVDNKDAYNIRVANMSLGATATTGYANDPLNAAVEVAWLRGIVVVASAGNAGPAAGTISVPGNDPFVVTVGAFDDNQTATPSDNLVPTWTSRGPTAFDRFNKPDLAASGRRVVSLRSTGSYLDELLPDRLIGTSYFRLSGTSMAAPVVSGVAALVIAQNPSLTPNEVKKILTRSARAMAYPATQVGAGAVDALAAVRLAKQGGVGRANVGLRVNGQAATVLWSVVKKMQPVWRHTGPWNGRYWVDGSWDLTSGFKAANGSWEDGSWDDGSWDDSGWDASAWDNFRWEDGSWDSGGWEDTGWDSLTALSITLLDGSWDTSALKD